MNASNINFNIMIDLKSKSPFKVKKVETAEDRLISNLINKLNQDNNQYPLINLNSSASNFFSTKSNFNKSSDKFYSTIRGSSDCNKNKKISPNKNLNNSFYSKDLIEVKQDIDNLISCYTINKPKTDLHNKRSNRIVMDKETKTKLMKKFKIIKKIDDDVKEFIAKNSNKSRNTLISSKSTLNIKDNNKTKVIIFEEYFRDPFKSYEKINVNKQIVNNINNMNNDKIIEAFIDKIKYTNDFNLKLKKMPLVKETYVNLNNQKKDIVQSIQYQIGDKGTFFILVQLFLRSIQK